MASYSGVDFATGKLAISVAANLNKNEIICAIATPEPIKAGGVDIFDRKEQSRILTARPNTKVIIGLSFDKSRFKASLNNTYFGAVTWQHAENPNFDQTFSGKWVTDVNLGYQLSEKVGFGIVVNNLLDVYPDEINNFGDVVTDLGGRFRYPWEVNQFGFNGMTLSANLNVKF